MADGAEFAANLLRAGVAHPEDWEATRKIGEFLQRTVERLVGDRAASIDYAFDVSLCLGTTASSWRTPEEIDPRRILLCFRVAHTVAWVNLMPALDLLESEHPSLPGLFYHGLRDSLSRWFRVFDVHEARGRWESWIEMREEDEAERRDECDREGVPYEPGEPLRAPVLPECVRMRRQVRNAAALTTSELARHLIEAIQQLQRVSRRAACPQLSDEDRHDLFDDTDAPVPLIGLAFGEHDVVTEFLNMELETAGQVEMEPCPVLKMDGTDPESIRKAFRCGRVALDTLDAAARVLSLVPGFEPMVKHNPYGAGIMYCDAEYGQSAPLRLMHAVLLYGSERAIRLATVHQPVADPQGGPPVLDAGEPLTGEFLESLVRGLGQELPAAMLPPYILVYSTRLIAWWEPPRIRSMFFAPDCDGKSLDGELFPHPALLFAVREGRLMVWALAEPRWPDPDTQLYMAPYWNVYSDSTVCHGSMVVPATAMIENLPQWSEAFFASRFTGSNLGIEPCAHPQGFIGMWRSLIRKKEFPVEYLLPRATVRETLCRRR